MGITKTSTEPLVSFSIRFSADEVRATKLPSLLTTAEDELLSPSAQSNAKLTRLVVLSSRSRTKTSSKPLVSSETKLLAIDEKTVNRLSELIDGLLESEFPPYVTS